MAKITWTRVCRPLAPIGLAIACWLTAAVTSAQSTEGSIAAPNLTADALIGDSVSDPDADRYSDVDEAIRRFRNRDQLSARTFLERAVQKNPKLPPVGVLLAKMQLLAGNASAVRSALEAAVQDDSATDPEPFLLLAEEALSSGRTIEADALFDKAVSVIEPYDANAKRKRQFQIRAYRGRAIIDQRRGAWEAAETNLRNWLEQDPDNSGAHQQLGQVLFMLGRERDGYESFAKAKSLNDDLPSPSVSAARMYSRLDKAAESMAAFEKAYNENRGDVRTLLAYAQALMRAGELERANSVLGEARQAGERQGDVLLLSGVSARMRGDNEAASQFLFQALIEEPSNRDVLNQLALTLAEVGGDSNLRRALTFAQMNQQLHADNGDVNVSLAWVLYQLGRGREANAAFQQAVRAGAFSADGSFLIAKMLIAQNQTSNAKRLIESALNNDQQIFVKRAEAEQTLGSL